LWCWTVLAGFAVVRFVTTIASGYLLALPESEC